MNFTIQTIRTSFSPEDYRRGLAYYQEGRVKPGQTTLRGSWVVTNYQVAGTQVYHVELKACRDQITGTCTCPRFSHYGQCKHLAAAMLAYADHPPAVPAGRQILEAYLAQDEPSSSQPARLVPRLNCWPGMTDYPEISFRVGRERLYVVKNVELFLLNFQDSRTQVYGKSLTLCHRMGEFDETSRQLIALLAGEVNSRRKLLNRLGRVGAYMQDTVQLCGQAFDRFFDLYQGQQLEYSQTVGEVTLTGSDPTGSLTLRPQGDTVLLELTGMERMRLFGAGSCRYTVVGNTMYRCSPAFSADVAPLLAFQGNAVAFSQAELPELCSSVLPALRRHMQVNDPAGIALRYAPDPCTPCFYFDYDGQQLTARLTCRYGSREIPWDQPAAAAGGVKRDLPAERAARRRLLAHFTWSGNCFALSGDDAVYAFLSEFLGEYQKYGEVYVSDRLQSRQLRPAPPVVGLSVSNGMLTLQLDTGEFPPEELERLYQSMLHRRRYHKLADGRFLTLDGSGCEALAEAAHMLQLSGQALAKGAVTLPAFRALYLDSVLGQKSGLEVNRDSQFRAMVRSFKTVEESGCMPPETLSGTLRPYQRTGFRWLKALESCGFGGILADEMGLGKTLQMIAFLATVPRQAVGLPSLIVCPASLVLNWGDEFARFAPRHRVLLLLGSAQERAKAMEEDRDSDVWVTSYDLLKRDVERYRHREFYCCVLDEGQFVKNQASKASAAVKSIACRQRFVLTGTPVENRLSELWNLFDFLMPGYLYSHHRFVEKLERPIVQSEDGQAREQLAKLVRPFLLRRLKQDVLKELPPKIERVRRIALSGEERKLYLAAAAAAKGVFSGGGKLDILAALTRLRQICCDPDLCFENYQGPASKLEACVELCAGMAENGRRILVFSQFTSMLSRLRARLEAAGLTCFTLQGSTPKGDRADLVRRFNVGEAQVFLISLKAGGTGLNLTAAEVVIHYDPWWNQAAQEQATGRAHRIGQRACVQVYRLIAKDTVEERILELQARKAQLMDILAQDGEAGLLSMSQAELMALLA